MKSATLERLVQIRAENRPVALVTDLSFGLQTLVFPETVEGDAGLRDEVLAEAREAMAQDRSGPLSQGDGRLFVTVYNPPAKLILIGAVHIAQALAPMAKLVGYAVTVIDPRGAFAEPERFDDVKLIREWPDEAMASQPLDSRTAVVTLTHDPKLDDPALIAALRAPVFYIGALGSRKTHASRLDRLRAEGFDDNALARIHGPLGFKLGGRSPAEIAISALAQITAARYGAPTQLTP